MSATDLSLSTGVCTATDVVHAVLRIEVVGRADQRRCPTARSACCWRRRAARCPARAARCRSTSICSVGKSSTCVMRGSTTPGMRLHASAAAVWPSRVGARSKFCVLDLDVDRRRQAEVQHLAHDVGGLEIEDACRGTRRRAARGCAAMYSTDGWCAWLAARSASRRPSPLTLSLGTKARLSDDRHADRVVDGVAAPSAGMISRMLSSTCGHDLLGALEARAARARGQCSLMMPTSAVGKKSVPTTGTSAPVDRDQHARSSPARTCAAQQHACQQRGRSRRGTGRSRGRTRRQAARPSPFRRRASWCSSLSSWRASAGTTVNDST